MHRRTVLVLVGATLASAAAEPSVLSGRVRTADGTPIPQAVLAVSGPGEAREIVSGPDGRYRVAGLPGGAYTIALETPGFVLRPGPRVLLAGGDEEKSLDLVVAPAPVREHVVVTATRGEATLSTVGVAADVLDGADIAEREAPDVVHLLQELPGVAVTRAGGPGVQASAFLRGGPSNGARVLVDGIPANEPGGAFNWGGAVPLELERVEVVRGAASSLYGTDALSGVVQLVTRRAPTGASPELRAEGDAGSFGWRHGRAGTSGRRGAFDWNLGLDRRVTDNQAPNSALSETAGAASLGARLGGATSLRAVFRGETGTAGTPGQVAFGRPDLDASFSRDALVTGVELTRNGARVRHVARLGFARASQISIDPRDSGAFVPRDGDRVGAFTVSDFPDPAGYLNDTRRATASYAAEATAGAHQVVTAGLDLERETGRIGSRAEDPLSPHRLNAGLYAQDRIVLGGRLFLTVGGRVERNASFGTRAVPRAAVAWQVRSGADATVLRASAGAGVKEPTFLESFGVSFYARGNPDLRPQESRSYDVGIDQRLFASRLRLQATAFRHEYEDEIAFQVTDFTTFQGTFVNLGASRAQGLEISMEAAPLPTLHLAGQYTLTDGRVLTSASDFDPVYAAGAPLLRRPRHQGSLSARIGGPRASLGATLLAVGRRADSDFLGLGLGGNPGYTRLDLRAHVRLTRNAEGFVVAENATDARYQEVLGYPALGRSMRVGLRLRVGGGA